jgi:hypothetical protein
MAAFLVGQGAGDEDGRGLWNACYCGRAEVAKALISHPKSSYTPADLVSALSVAAYRPAVGLLEVVLDSGVDINAKNSNGSTALIVACESTTPFGSANTVKQLLDRGADIFATLDLNDSDKYYSTGACVFTLRCYIASSLYLLPLLMVV